MGEGSDSGICRIGRGFLGEKVFVERLRFFEFVFVLGCLVERSEGFYRCGRALYGVRGL